MRSPTPKGTARTERMPWKVTVLDMKRGSCCASDVRTERPCLTTSSIMVRLPRNSPTSVPRSCISAAPAAGERHGQVEPRAVVVSAVGRAEVLEEVLVALAPHLGVDARGERVGDAHVVARRATDGYAQPPQREMLGRAVGVVDD